MTGNQAGRRSGAAFSGEGLSRLRQRMQAHVDAGDMPGLVYALSRHGETEIVALGAMEFGGPAMPDNAIFRIASMSKPVLGVATMMLVEDCVLRLDQPVDGLLPELANRRVLRRREGPADDTEPAMRPITVRDLLTMQAGFGVIAEWPGRYPIQQAYAAAGVAPGPHPYVHGHDDFMRGLGRLPLVHQPGEGWMYQTCYDVLAILLSRATDRPLGELLAERIFEPLGMSDTGFFVPENKLDRLPALYERGEHGLVVADPAGGGWYAGQPPFERAGAELVSTARDYVTFCRAMLGEGTLDGRRLISRASMRLMTVDHTPEALKRGPDAAMFFRNGGGWGFQVGVDVRRTQLWTNPGRFGWDGGYGTTGYTDPNEELIAVLLTQRTMDSPQPQDHYLDFWTLVYAALE